MKLPLHVRIEDSSGIGEARRLAAALCRNHGFDETRIGEVGIVVTELATNLIKHTRGAGGDLIFRPMQEAGATGLDILSLDKGPGLTNISESLRDGFSTAGSSGTGLGAIRRLSAEFDIYTAPGKGVAVFSRLWKKSAPEIPPTLAVGAVCLPVQGEQACGDAWAVKVTRDSTLFMLADGLGHGPDAAVAADKAVTVFENLNSRDPASYLEAIHAGLRHTRGAAVAVASVALDQRIVRFAGVGNLTGWILGGPSRGNLVSYNGTAGVEARKIQEFSYAWPEGGLLVLSSDGLDTKWNLDDYPGLARKAPALIAGVLFRDHNRPRDDTSIIVAKEGKAP